MRNAEKYVQKKKMEREIEEVLHNHDLKRLLIFVVSALIPLIAVKWLEYTTGTDNAFLIGHIAGILIGCLGILGLVSKEKTTKKIDKIKEDYDR